jgi:hypothetical protein
VVDVVGVKFNGVKQVATWISVCALTSNAKPSSETRLFFLATALQPHFAFFPERQLYMSAAVPPRLRNTRWCIVTVLPETLCMHC